MEISKFWLQNQKEPTILLQKSAIRYYYFLFFFDNFLGKKSIDYKKAAWEETG